MVKTNTNEPAAIQTARTQPVALLLTGTKYKDLEPLMDLDIPLNLALEPASPFALRNAVLGARHWHEIVLDIRHSSEFVIDALPFSTALLSTTELSVDSMNTVVTSDTVEVFTDQTKLPNTAIWLLNMATISTDEVEQWLKISLHRSTLFVCRTGILHRSNDTTRSTPVFFSTEIEMTL